MAFGDVLLAAFTVAVPAALSWRAVFVTFVATALIAGGIVIARVVRLGSSRPHTVPLAPALLGGWLCGLVVG